MKLAIYVMHVPGTRETELAKLLARVPSAIVKRDPDRLGAWSTAKRCWEAGIASGADWIAVLNDDADPCPDFAEVAAKALRALDDSLVRFNPVCFYTAHPRAREAYPSDAVSGGWYTTHDDLVGVGCALPRAAAIDFLRWVDENPKVGDFSDDGRLNLWAIARGRRVFTTVPSLVDHQLPDESMVSTKEDHARRAVVPPETDMAVADWRTEDIHLGRARSGNQWEMLHRLETVEPVHIERAYEVYRHGKPVSEKPHVFIAMPAYVTPEAAVRASVQRIVEDLQAHGIGATYYESGGDSLVTRGRHGLVHEMLCTTATHLLQWDADIECLDPTAVRKMVETKHDVVGGAYPWRDGSGRVVANPLPETMRDRMIDVDPATKCLRVSEVGTGFLLTSRKMLVDLCAKHPETMYQADIEPYVGAPMWALFDAHLEMRENGRRRYASEDWRFCQLAREAGYGVFVYYPPVFRHWGKTAHQGHIVKAWGLSGQPETAPG